MMKNKFWMISLVLVAFLVFLPLFPAAASDGTIPGQFVFGQSFTLKNGQTMNGDLMVFGGSATIEKGATVNGNVVVFGGSLTINGSRKPRCGDFRRYGHARSNCPYLWQPFHPGFHIGPGRGFPGGWAGQQRQRSFWKRAEWLRPVRRCTPINPFASFMHFAVNPFLSWVANVLGQSVTLALLAMLLMLFLAQRATGWRTPSSPNL